MFPRIISLGVTGSVALLLSMPAVAVEAERTEAGQALAEQEHPASEKVTTTKLTSSMNDGKPGEDQRAFENTVKTIYFYTVLEGLKGQTVTHRWKYAGRVIATVDIPVTEDPFTTWSSNDMEPDWTGFWTVEVLNSNSQVVGFETFVYSHPQDLQMDPGPNRLRHGAGHLNGAREAWGINRDWDW
jgi:hypothetical protein